jgi:hypothetical protein
MASLAGVRGLLLISVGGCDCETEVLWYWLRSAYPRSREGGGGRLGSIGAVFSRSSGLDFFVPKPSCPDADAAGRLGPATG